jgi:Amidohydrolase family
MNWLAKLLTLCALLTLPAPLLAKSSYDLVITGGRVIDPETGFDAVRNVGIRNGVTVTISRSKLSGRRTINAKGLVVAPGFIDVHSHSPTLFGALWQVRDGVTTQLDLEAGAFPVAAYGDFFAKGAPVHYGASVSHLAVRAKVIEGKDAPYLFNTKGAPDLSRVYTERASPEQIAAMRAMLHAGIDQGGIGIGVLLDYISVAVGADELSMIFEVAGKRAVPVTVHVRRGMPGDAAGLEEVIALAEKHRAPLLVNHITHSAMHRVGDWLAMIDAANARGAAITTETLSYEAGGTSIGAAVFGRDWRKIFNIDYGDVQWTATGEWLTQESFERYRREQPGGAINHHYVKPAWMHRALAWPKMMVVSDATPAFNEKVMTNPNLSGSFSRLIGHYARDQKLMPQGEALAKSSLYQAQWLERVVPAFKRKGRLRKGMDADIVIFDANQIAAGATYGKPYAASVGVRHVIVGGQSVMENGMIVAGVLPGKRIVAGRSGGGLTKRPIKTPIR